MVLATKFGNLGGRGGKIADGRPEFVISSCEASLKRLGVDVIDLYYQHRIDPTVPTEDTVGAMAKLVEAGQGPRARLERSEPADHSPRPCRAQDRGGAERILAALSRRGRGDAADDARSSASLSSPIRRSAAACSPARSKIPQRLPTTMRRKRHPRFAAENIGHNLGLVQKIAEISRKKNCTPGQLALAWLLAQGDDIVPIPGTKHKDRLIENIGALSVKLSADDLAQISQRRTGRRRCRLALSRRADEERLRLRAVSAVAAPKPWLAFDEIVECLRKGYTEVPPGRQRLMRGGAVH